MRVDLMSQKYYYDSFAPQMHQFLLHILLAIKLTNVERCAVETKEKIIITL